ncbi:hypothetical protein D3C81_1808270 [compost metagenome]
MVLKIKKLTPSNAHLLIPAFACALRVAKFVLQPLYVVASGIVITEKLAPNAVRYGTTEEELIFNGYSLPSLSRPTREFSSFHMKRFS